MGGSAAAAEAERCGSLWCSLGSPGTGSPCQGTAVGHRLVLPLGAASAFQPAFGILAWVGKSVCLAFGW